MATTASSCSSCLASFLSRGRSALQLAAELGNQTNEVHESSQSMQPNQSRQSTESKESNPLLNIDGFIVGREEEHQQLQRIISCHLAEGRGGSVCLCGPPGSGKTMVMREVVGRLMGGVVGELEEREGEEVSAAAAVKEGEERSGGGVKRRVGTRRGRKKRGEDCSQRRQPVEVIFANCMLLPHPKLIFDMVASKFQVPPNGQWGGGKQRKFPRKSRGPMKGMDPNGEQSDCGGERDAVLSLDELFRAARSSCGLVEEDEEGDAQEQPFIILCVDEVDVLLSTNQSLLRDLLRLPTCPDAKILLIAISNSIHLVERVAPSLRPFKCLPQVVPFPAYSADQIQRAIQQRLEAAGLPQGLFHPRALELVARKVAASSGDMRRALDICRDAIHACELESSKRLQEEERSGKGKLVEEGAKSSGEGMERGEREGGGGTEEREEGSNRKREDGSCKGAEVVCRDARAAIFEESDENRGRGKVDSRAIDGHAAVLDESSKMRRQQRGTSCSQGECFRDISQRHVIELRHVALCLSRISRSPTADIIKALPLHHQATLLAVLLSSGSSAKETSMAEAFRFYTSLCLRKSLPSLSLLEFRSMCSALEDHALVSVGKAKSDLKRKISLRVAEDEILLPLQAIRLFSEDAQVMKVSLK